MRRQFIGALLLAAAIAAVDGKSPDPLTYTIRFPDPASKSFTVDVSVPTERRESVDLMMPVWSPGFYGLQNYAQRVSDVTATAADGTVLPITTPTTSRWTVAVGGRPAFTLTYTVAAPRPSNLGNGVREVATRRKAADGDGRDAAEQHQRHRRRHRGGPRRAAQPAQRPAVRRAVRERPLGAVVAGNRVRHLLTPRRHRACRGIVAEMPRLVAPRPG